MDTSQPPTPQWQQGQVLELTIDDLADQGEGVGRWQQRVVFVPDTVIGDRVAVRLIYVKPQYAHGRLLQILEPSPHRVRPACFVADKCGGCQWQQVEYDLQLTIKRNLVIQALERIGGFSSPPVDPMLAATDPLGYRNKATYPLGLSATRQVQAGYYQRGSHQLINLNQCPVQDGRLNPLLAAIKLDIQQRGWSIYDESTHTGTLRHLSLRIGRRTGEVLLTLVAKTADLPDLELQAQEWLHRYPQVVGVALNLNPAATNTIFGRQTQAIAGRIWLGEEFAGLKFQIQPTTFFQVFTEQAERLLGVILQQLHLQGDELLVDAYCGIGTLTLPLATEVRQAIGLEVQPEAVAQAEKNAALNRLTNVTFQTGTVEEQLPALIQPPDIVVLDPPRKGCDRSVLATLQQIQPHQIVYVSCNPATLARDLKILCEDGRYQLQRVQPADFFPQTSHVEAAAFLVRLPLSGRTP
ncbi:RNA methyltransferase [Neosynechococcus sphagnicola sy1]|uniref:RNA methyltransferase n=1 Tax=Neosynechococcus sphagnicola sy1 TaxID=1497020 RepID=A0A098TIJ7_9CYAN|nr:RNA methyltransferase [Neosynechococcus sphagnicola sy1]